MVVPVLSSIEIEDYILASTEKMKNVHREDLMEMQRWRTETSEDFVPLFQD